jgi:LysM repeat protein/ABC-type branched-subunit amino acid transport system substrate-binding protein
MGMIKSTYTYLFLLAFSFSVLSADAQETIPVKKSNLTETIDGKKYFLHTVEKGQTLYSISKVYGVSVADISNDNPELSEGLKMGQTIKIPTTDKKESKPIKTNESGTVILHKVEKQQTLYGISKLYNVDIESIKFANPGVDFSQLKVGEEIKIPQMKIEITSSSTKTKEVEVAEKQEVKESLPKYSGPIRRIDEIDVNLLLPLLLYQNDSVIQKNELTKDDLLAGKSLPAVEFLSGFKIACDSLSKQGFKIRMNVLDVPVDSLAAVNYFAKNKMPDAHLWVGPFHSHTAFIAGDYAKSVTVGMVIPLAQQPKLLLGNPYAVKLAPSPITQTEQLADFAFSKNSGSRFILVHNQIPKEKTSVSVWKKKGLQHLKNDSLREVVYKNSGMKGLTFQLSKSKPNVIAVVSNDQAFVTDFINKILPMLEEHKITLIGLESWLGYDNLDISSLQKLNLHLPSLYFTNYADTGTVNFIRHYRDRFHTEPTRYSYLGFDAAWYFLNSIKRNGPQFHSRLPDDKATLTQTRFQFYKSAQESGYENKGIYILKYEDFELKLAD